jgi:subtilase family serine protease
MRHIRVVAAIGLSLGILMGWGGPAFGASLRTVRVRAAAAHAPPAPTSAQCRLQNGLGCYSPGQIRAAYNLGPLYARGLNGRGRTIVIVDPFGSPTIGNDLAVFDRAFGLRAPPSFRVLQPVGPVPPFDSTNSAMLDKAGETTEDVEWAHAIAPAANILLVETPTPETLTGGGFPQYMAAENYVITHRLGDVISQSFSLPEQNFKSKRTIRRLRYAFLNAFRRHISVLAATNDTGVTGFIPGPVGAYTHRVVYWPASDPLVTGVGGTRVQLNASGRRTSPDTAWNDTFNSAVSEFFFKVPAPWPWAGGGGVSTIFGRPQYQNGVQRVVGDKRGLPDVSLSGAISSGIVIYESLPGKPGVWGPTGGTSGATPMFAGLVAIADQLAKKRLGLINPSLYQLERQRGPGIVDVTRGNNNVVFPATRTKHIAVRGYAAKRGYDLATGVGTVNAARLVPELARAGAHGPANTPGMK